MVETEEKLETIEVVKRNGKKVEFDGTKVALAIKKGFDSILIEEDEKKYSEKDIQKVYQAVIKKIAKEYLPLGKIKIEEVQDLIEDMLKKYDLPYDEIYYKQNKKGKIAKELNVSYFIDDKEKVLDEVKEYGIQTIWYTNEKKESKHLIFSNWLDIANYIIERSN